MAETEGDGQRPRQPRTPPPTDAVGRLKRLGSMPDWEVRILDPDTRSVWDERDGHRLMVINKKYCLYEQREGDDLYVAESAALRLADEEGEDSSSVEDYVVQVNLIMRAFCEVYDRP